MAVAGEDEDRTSLVFFLKDHGTIVTRGIILVTIPAMNATCNITLTKSREPTSKDVHTEYVLCPQNTYKVYPSYRLQVSIWEFPKIGDPDIVP